MPDNSRYAVLVDTSGRPADVIVGVYRRRKCKHYARNGTGVTLCGYQIPDRARWRVRLPERMYASCERCRLTVEEMTRA